MAKTAQISNELILNVLGNKFFKTKTAKQIKNNDSMTILTGE